MPQLNLRNQEYRDELLKFAYPFDERSSLENDELFIGTDLFLDTIIYLKEAAELPLYISEVDGTYGELDEFQILISDNTGVIKARASVDINNCQSTVRNNEDVIVGTILYNDAGLKRFIGRVSGKLFSLLPDTAAFSLDVTHVATTQHLRYVKAANQAVYGDVEVIARHGVQWVVQDNVLHLDVLGDAVENAFATPPVRSVNGVRNPSIWLAGHPRANLRISTEDGVITFIVARDAT